MPARLKVRRRTPESDVVRQCLELLHHLGIFAFRVNSGAARGEYKGRRRYVRFTSMPGVSDILFVAPDGKFGALECKARRGKLTAEQSAFLLTVGQKGGIALIVRDVFDLQKHLRLEYGIG